MSAPEMSQVLPEVSAFLRRDHGLYINGRWTPSESAAKQRVYDPATGQVIANVVEASVSDGVPGLHLFSGPARRQMGVPVFMPPQPTCLYLSCADGDVRLDAHAGCGDSFPPTDVRTWTRECSWPHSHRGHARFHKPHKSILLQQAVLDPAGRCAPRIANTLVL